MDDLIRRQDVLDIIMGDGLYCDTYDDKEYSAERIKSIPTVDLSEYCDKLWKTAYERGKVETSVVTMKLDADWESLKKAMQDAELTLVSEPRKGNWIDGNEGKWNAVYCPKCSVCGTPFYGIETVRYHYCPNCGARMEE